MASTFKLALAGSVLSAADVGRLKLDEQLRIRPQQMFPHAPVVRAAGVGASLSLHQLCAAAVEASDNGAANLLLERIGGPPALTRFFRRCGDTVSRLDRYEMELNSNLPGDPRDTTSPAAMLHTMRTLLLGDLLKPASRQLLTSWMVNSNRGLDRLRAGLPGGWHAGSKAGTGARGAMNDLLIAWPPNRAPILIASYLDAPAAPERVRTWAHRDIAKRVTALLG
jgi:beta-lactamase class A